ncbi:response regulator [Paenibacillus sp. FSL H8-0034]|uniref:response regulator n=1 Tax=Paenibacillus sp. FSL H8-0034 TaxID=2954671 RepID=UPI0030FA1568
MYTLMVVEDEPLIRAGLKQYFDWAELGIKSIVEADNGKQGLLTGLRERPDLVITDIRMPEMDGLEMIGQLRAELPNTVFVILTGYNDFKYAQQAIRLGGVHAFLLKPLQYEESLATIRECIQNLDNKRQEAQARLALQLEAAESSQLKRNQLIKYVLEEEEPALTEESLHQLYGFKGTACCYLTFVAARVPHPSSLSYSITNRWPSPEADQLITELVNIMFTSKNIRQPLTYISKSKLYAVIIIEAQDHSDFTSWDEETLDTLLKQVSMQGNASVFMAMGPMTAELAKVGMSLRLAEKALVRRYFQAGRHLLQLSPAEHAFPYSRDSALPFNEKDKSQMLSCLELGDDIQIKLLMRRLSQEMSTGRSEYPTEPWLAFLQELITVTLRFAYSNGIQIEGVYSDKLLSLACVDDFQTSEALFDWLADWMIRLSSVYQQQSLPAVQQESLIFDQIEIYIKQHIDQDITLQMVADRFFYNPSYLSRLFKTKLKKNYMTFVTEIRIHYAQECLMQPHYLITDVCQMCGYKSYKHFVKTFRAVTQMTPTEYRKQVRS